jgi:hypothetical protein
VTKNAIDRLRDGDRPKNQLEHLHDHLVRMAEARDTALFRYMEFRIDPPTISTGCWWMDVCLGESRTTGDRWVVQWWIGLTGFGISKISDDTSVYTHQPDEFLPTPDDVARKLGLLAA